MVRGGESMGSWNRKLEYLDLGWECGGRCNAGFERFEPEFGDGLTAETQRSRRKTEEAVAMRFAFVWSARNGMRGWLASTGCETQGG